MLQAGNVAKLMEATTDSSSRNEDQLSVALKRWRAQVERDLKGAPFEKRLITRTIEGIALRPLYTRVDLPVGLDAEELPGESTLRRGLRPHDRAKACRRLQTIKRADAKGFNQALLAALMNGQDAVVMPQPSTGDDGHWSPRSVAELTEALAGVDLTAVPLYFEMADDSQQAAALLTDYAKATGLDLTQLSGSLAVDPLATAIRRGALPSDGDGRLDDLAKWLNWAKTNVPQMRAVGVDVSEWNDAGANAVQELAFALSSVVELIRTLAARGVPAETVLSQLLVRFATGPQFFMELAKFRAWRVLLAKLLVGLELDSKWGQHVEVNACSSKWNKTLLDKHVNLLRLTTESLSAVLGGVDGLQIDPFDSVTGASSVWSERVARNLHLLLVDEFGFSVPQDAAGGSWYIESLTDELARQSWGIFREIEGEGGMTSALIAGWPQAQVAVTVATRDRDFASRRNGLLGTNLFPNPTDPAPRVGLETAKATVADATEVLAAAPPYRAAAAFERLRVAAVEITAKRERAPTVYLAKIGSIKAHQARADFAAEFMAVGGFAVEGGSSPETSEADVVVICSTDDQYLTGVTNLVPVLKQAKPERVVILAGLPRDPEILKNYQQAGVDEFIHGRADLPEILSRLLNRLGANL
jgi:methylmalonyl-CoA mutase